MACPKCGAEQTGSSSSCSSCGSRFTKLEWSLSGPALACIVCLLLFVGGMAGWFFFGRSAHVVTPIQPAPASSQIQPPKPSAGSPSNKQPRSAPANTLQPPEAPQRAIGIAVPFSAPHPLPRNFGPFRFKLAAHQTRSLVFYVPADLPIAKLRGGFTSSGGIGRHVHIRISRDTKSLFDSESSATNQFDLRLPQGKYALTINNTAFMLSREITIQGNFSAVP